MNNDPVDEFGAGILFRLNLYGGGGDDQFILRSQDKARLINIIGGEGQDRVVIQDKNPLHSSDPAESFSDYQVSDDEISWSLVTSIFEELNPGESDSPFVVGINNNRVEYSSIERIRINGNNSLENRFTVASGAARIRVAASPDFSDENLLSVYENIAGNEQSETGENRGIWRFPNGGSVRYLDVGRTFDFELLGLTVDEASRIASELGVLLHVRNPLDGGLILPFNTISVEATDGIVTSVSQGVAVNQR